MQRLVEFNVGESAYKFNTFNSTKGLNILDKLLQIAGPSLTELFSDVDLADPAGASEINLAEISIRPEVLSRAASLLIRNLGEVGSANLARDMCSDLMVDGKEVVFDQHFAGNYGHLVKVLTTIIKENYSSFFEGGGFGALSDLMPSRRG